MSPSAGTPHDVERWREAPTVLASAWRYKYWIVAAAIVATAAAYYVSSLAPETYAATARMFLADPRGGSVFSSVSSVDAERYVPQQAERVTSVLVLQRAAADLGDGWSPGEVGRRIDAEADVELNVITVTATSRSPEGAAELANTVADAYQETSRQTKLDSAQRAADELVLAQATIDEQIAELRSAIDLEDASGTIAQQQLDALLQERAAIGTRAQQMLVDARVFGSGVDLVEPAEPSASPASPTPVRDAALFGVLAVGLAVAAAYWRAGRARRVESRKDPARILDIPYLGSVPIYKGKRDKTLDERLDLTPVAGEAYHFLHVAISHELARHSATSLLVSSVAPGDGKTEIALQVAVAARFQGRHAVLVDGDLRVRRLTHLARLDAERGLADLATFRGDQDALLSHVHTVPALGRSLELAVVPAGSVERASTSVLRQPGVGHAITRLSELVDLVVVDSAPLLATADTMVLASQVDAMLLVIREGTELSTLEQLRDRLEFVGCRVLGYVYVGKDADESNGYGYGYERATPRSAAVDGGLSWPPRDQVLDRIDSLHQDLGSVHGSFGAHGEAEVPPVASRDQVT